ncbi:MAG: neutral/alkaline non-lysosomal ceramidase N-terminal domain-containing protein, partial [Cytophagales bacterium]|nr:neutral/alkaline non-lysosomal ceramidase N-terminal domain-containing protein [Cytophagales bacterium]
MNRVIRVISDGIRGRILLFLIFFSAAFSSESFGNSTGWKAGVARVSITPSRPMWLGGYASRLHASEGKLHDLWVKALALEDAGGARAVLITTDLLGIPKNVSDRIRARLRELYGLSAGQIILNSSHTHSGPVLDGSLADIYTMNSGDWDQVCDYTRNLEVLIVDVTGRALHSMKSVNLYSGNGVARFQVNRRQNMEDNLWARRELKGPNEYAVPVLKVSDKRGKVLAVAFGYACHPTVLNG